jgi:hypothetical protein
MAMLNNQMVNQSIGFQAHHFPNEHIATIEGKANCQRITHVEAKRKDQLGGLSSPDIMI